MEGGMVATMTADPCLQYKTPQTCHHGSHPGRSRPPSCWVILTLVLLVVSVLSLAIVSYLFAVELRHMRSDLDEMAVKLQGAEKNLLRLNYIQQMRVFEQDLATPTGEDDDEEEEEEEDDLDPVFADHELFGDDFFPVESRTSDGARNVQPLMPAGSLRSTVDGEVIQRSRRDVRPEPRLRLYHTLQTYGPAAESWASPYGYGGHRSAMYAEQPPVGFVRPPPPPPPPQAPPTTAASTATTISRRSRVKDSVPKPQRHKKVQQQQQQQQQPQRWQLQEQVPQWPRQRQRQGQGPARSPRNHEYQYQYQYQSGRRRGERVTD